MREIESIYSDLKKYERCEYCANCVYIGDGDYMCDVDLGMIVLDEFVPSEDYYWCKGHHYQLPGGDEEEIC